VRHDDGRTRMYLQNPNPWPCVAFSDAVHRSLEALSCEA
jgi:hypothetical protein